MFGGIFFPSKIMLANNPKSIYVNLLFLNFEFTLLKDKAG